MREKDLLFSFKNACSGLFEAIRRERNLKFHLLAAAIVFGLALWFELSPVEMVVLFFAITLVLLSELFNTSIEAAVDLFTEEYHPLARMAKNVAAGAVLVACLNALMVAYYLFFVGL